jgi:HAD superfamily hydrolase (TIGR01509 family)
MIKAVFFDADGMIVRREMYFSDRLSRDFNISLDKITPFFQKEFQLCLVGKADLKEEIKKYLKDWNWQKSIDDLLIYWFQSEKDIDERMIKVVNLLKGQGIKCYLHTNNEKYRADYITNNLGLNKFFDKIFSSSNIGYLKSQIEFWQVVFNDFIAIEKDEVLVFDDAEKNITVAKQFGFRVELYSNFDKFESKLKSLIAV